MNHLSEEDMIKNIEQLIAFLPTVHVGTVSLEIMFEEYKKAKQELQQEKEKNKKLEEVIEMMAEDALDGEIINYNNQFINIDEIKLYYFKKARGEEDG